MFTSFAVTTNNTVERVKFVDAKPVYFPPMANNAKWASDNGSSVAWKTAAIRDKDGSLTGIPNSYVLIDDGVIDTIAVDRQACENKPAWNAAICKGDVGRLSIGGPGGGRGAGPGRGGPGGPAVPGAGRGAPGAAPAGGAPALAVGQGAPGGPGGAVGRGGPGAGGPGRGAGSGAPGGRAGGAAAPQQPVILSRNGKEYNVTAATVLAGTEVKVTTERPTVSLALTELEAGSWVIFELPGFTTAASGAEQSSLDALRAAIATSYYKGKDALWVKVVSTADGGRGGGGSLQVSR
jgi:cell migration-inducing and hyaluronan-binding protein